MNQSTNENLNLDIDDKKKKGSNEIHIESDLENKNKDKEIKKEDKKKKEKPKKKSEIEILNDTIKEKNKEIEQHKNKFAFIQAELENMRKHYMKQQISNENNTKIKIITSFTPLIDSFEMAFKIKENLSLKTDNNQLKNFIDGFQAIYDNIKNIFKNYKVTAIEDVNIPFDYKKHEVILKIINDDIEEDTVMQIVQKGYKMDNEVIRPAKVIVSKKTPPPPKPIEKSKNDKEDGENKSLEENSSIDQEKKEVPKA